jgi:hypothetical protein
MGQNTRQKLTEGRVMASRTAKRKLLSLPGAMPPRAQVALEDHLRLKGEYEELRTEFTALQKQVERHTSELHLQFVRIAQIQAVLDEEMKDSLAKLKRAVVPLL